MVDNGVIIDLHLFYHRFLYFRPKHKDRPSRIEFRHRIKSESKNYVRSTGLKVTPEQWDFKKRWTKGIVPGVTNKLHELNQKVVKHFEKALTDDIPITSNYLDLLFDEKATDLFSSLELMIEERKELSKGTRKHYSVLLNRLLEFDDSLSFDRIDHSFLDAFVDFLYSKGASDNTVGRYIVRIKSFMNWSLERRFHRNYTYKEFKGINKPTDEIALTRSELEILESLSLTGYRKRTLDLFLVGVYSGQRFSDYSIFQRADIQGDFIVKRAKKTGHESFIPLHSKLRNILEEYNWRLPKISNQVFNRYIKQICKESGINGLHKKVDHRRGKVTSVCERWELVRSHTARRTFITLALENKIPYKQVMDITGITDIRTLMGYHRVEKDGLMDSVKGLF